MAKLLMNDEVDHTSRWHPTHILSKDNKLLQVYIGAAGHMLGGFGIYVADRDYEKIRHDKAYVFIHNPDCTDDDIENVDWEEVVDIGEDTDKKTNREHMHLWQD
jgi:hypothetical protein